ncbi:AT-hook motif nuclear-localized protein 9 [Impatiens glandulifera]|uniref:AT-hook motif nuclear-localized protein 9 n=1 Tax=Impatiens glandulifera TaxID=253017 RepID=UPI001FB0C23C|nr:AT-hook motif nuclear-localized protein 9 [Impatiens glandulifera]XP_047339226.1 AT-hook motif nuclear-localized protein 9 [Impatiens glandulifera]XP_047339227.1 AT-hook motif nuclear-localized protein 9 [Impatiens glandulifera]XP_047339228.1 AT-hook motif nuclear-localized protein 9 [Impatiens glandulifera]
MDHRDPMALSGSTYYMQRELAGVGIRQMSGHNNNMFFQSNVIDTSMGSSLPPTAISSHMSSVPAPAGPAPSGLETVKRKRGRPRKYGPDGAMGLQLSNSSNTVPVSSNQKRGRGRPPGSGSKQQLASLGKWLSNTAGTGFTPHVILIGSGEDITSKILSFSQQGPRAICVLSANGSVSTATLCQSSTSGSCITYEGRFEILCLSGSYLVANNGRTGGLSVSLVSPDGRVIGGGVGGVLIAASPVQVIIGSFNWGSGSTKMKNKVKEEETKHYYEGGQEQTRVDNDDDQIMSQANVVLNPNHTIHAPVGLWPGSRSLDMHMPADIDLMRD